MRVLVAGSSGLIGTALCRALGTAGHQVERLVRSEPGSDDEIFWDPEAGGLDATALAGIEALGRSEPVSLAAFRCDRLRRWVERTVAERDLGAIYVFSGQMGQYVPHDWQGRLVVDLVDVDSAKFDAYARAASGPRAWIDAREGRLMRRVEADLASRADQTLLVSEAEAALLLRGLRVSIDSCCFCVPTRPVCCWWYAARGSLTLTPQCTRRTA